MYQYPFREFRDNRSRLGRSQPSCTVPRAPQLSLQHTGQLFQHLVVDVLGRLGIERRGLHDVDDADSDPLIRILTRGVDLKRDHRGAVRPKTSVESDVRVTSGSDDESACTATRSIIGLGRSVY